MLLVWEIHLGWRRGVETVPFDIAHDTHNGLLSAPRLGQPYAEVQLLSDWIHPGPVAAGGLFVDHHYFGSRLVVMPVEQAAGAQRDAQRLEIVRGDDAHPDGGRVGGIGLAGAREARARGEAFVERQPEYARRRLDAGARGEAVGERLHELARRRAGLVLRFRQAD